MNWFEFLSVIAYILEMEVKICKITHPIEEKSLLKQLNYTKGRQAVWLIMLQLETLCPEGKHVCLDTKCVISGGVFKKRQRELPLGFDCQWHVRKITDYWEFLFKKKKKSATWDIVIFWLVLDFFLAFEIRRDDCNHLL